MPHRIRSLVALATLIVATGLLAAVAPVQAAAPPSLASAPRSMSFGKVTIGEPLLGSVTITNPGTTQVMFITPSFAGSADFDDAGTTCFSALNPGDTCQYFIVYDPSDRGRDTGTITFDLINCGNCKDLKIAVSGTGVEA